MSSSRNKSKKKKKKKTSQPPRQQQGQALGTSVDRSDDLIFSLDDDGFGEINARSPEPGLALDSSLNAPTDSLGHEAGQTAFTDSLFTPINGVRPVPTQADFSLHDDVDLKLGSSVQHVEIVQGTSPDTSEFPFLEMRLDETYMDPPQLVNPSHFSAPVTSTLSHQGAPYSTGDGLSRQMDHLSLDSPEQFGGDIDESDMKKKKIGTQGNRSPKSYGVPPELTVSLPSTTSSSGSTAALPLSSQQDSIATQPAPSGLACALQRHTSAPAPSGIAASIAAGNKQSLAALKEKKPLRNCIRLGPDDFELLKVIGRGAYGKVFLVRRKANHKLYAMKVLRKKDIIQKKVVGHTKSERSVLETINHQFFVQLRYAFQTPSKLYLILDYVPGGELFTRLDVEREFSESTAAFYAAEVVLALEHLHNLDIIYRDLKPENILLDREGHIRLTDFGFAKADIKSNHESKTFCGTIHYMAPEIILKKGHGKAADWWALGVLIFEMVAGETPFYANNKNDISKKILNAQIKYKKWMTTHCRNIISQLLSRPTEKRLGTRAGGADDIKKHSFFRHIDWARLAKKEVEAPFKPNFAGDLDTSHFDEEFTSERPVDSPAASPSPSLLQGGSALSSTPLFQGFSYYGGSPCLGAHTPLQGTPHRQFGPAGLPRPRIGSSGGSNMPDLLDLSPSPGAFPLDSLPHSLIRRQAMEGLSQASQGYDAGQSARRY